MLLDYLRDMVKYTSRLGFNTLELNGENGIITIEGSDENNKTLVLKGKFLKPVTELNGRCGFGNVEWLSNYVNAYDHKDDTAIIVRKDATVSVEVRDDDDNIVMDASGEPKMKSVTQNVIEEIIFERGTQMKNEYRVMDVRMLSDQPKFGGLPWDIEIEPTSHAIDLLATQAGFGVENHFGIIVDDKTLYLTFGKTAVIEFAYDVEGEISKPWEWDVKKILDVLKLSSGAKCSMHFSDRGALQITLNSGLAEYNYIIPAKA